MALQAGDQAPEFQLAGSDGQIHRLRDFAGKTVVLYFYPRDSTPGCTKEACSFRDRHAAFTARNVVVIGVSRDSIPSHQKFIGNHSLPFLLLSDPDATMMKAYGAYGEKVLYGKVSAGTLRSTVIIAPDGTIRKVWPLVKKAEDHPQEVLDLLSKEG